MTPNSLLLQVEGIHKNFPGVKALDGVGLHLHPGEVLAIVGENGAGKSTLMKILGGVYVPDGGTIEVEGEIVSIANVNDAVRLGISLVHQELNLAENLSIAANIFLGREHLFGGGLRLLEKVAMREEAQKLLQRVGLDLSPEEPVWRLSPGKKQLVEIARALSMQVRILILDEPTSSLTQKETDQLYKVIDDLKADGVSILYISHRLAEVTRVADRVVVLRDGKNAGELISPANRTQRPELQVISHASMVQLMVGRDLQQFFHRQHQPRREEIRMELVNFCYKGVPGRLSGVSEPINLNLYSGEILGMAGLVGAGRTELGEAIFGLRPMVSGDLVLDHKKVHFKNPWEAIAAGVLLVPEDRRYHGLILIDSIEDNLGLPNLDHLSYLGLISTHAKHDLAVATRDKLNIRTPNVRQRVGLLSGGNQQKVVLGKWLARQPKVLIVDEPTRGVDVGAKSEIYALLDQLVQQGVGILMISSDLEEILGISDRVAVMHEGRLSGVLNRSELSEQAVMLMATGGSSSP